MPNSPDWTKLGPLYVTRAQAEAAASEGRAIKVYPDGMEALAEYSVPGVGAVPKKASAKMMGERLSAVGTYPMSGVVNMDANPRLPPDVWRGFQTQIGVVDQMRQEDPVIKAITYAWCLPIIRSHWKVEPGGDDARALEEAEFIRANLFEYLRGGFYQFVEQAVSAVWRGFSLFEIVARFDRDSKQVRLDQLSPMLPRTVYQWSRYPEGAWGCTQTSYVGDPNIGQLNSLSDMGPSFPPEKLLHFVWDPDGDDPEGTSILRPCYGGWKSRRLYLKLEASGYERGAFGIPYVEVAPTARVGDSSVVNEILRELRTGARAWASLPPGYTLKFADFPMKGADIREARRAAGADMARAALTPFITTGDGKVGSFALIQGQQDFFTMALQSAADMIGKVLSHGSSSLIQRLCGWNYERSESFPKLTPGSISIGDPKALVEAIKTATEAGALTADNGIEEAVRSALGLPEMPEHESQEEMEYRLKNRAPTEIIDVEHDRQEDDPEPDPPTKPNAPKVDEVTDDQADAIEDEGERMEKLAELPGRRAVSGRELRAEEQVVRFEETLAPMQGIKEAMAQAAVDWREAMAPKYAERMARAGDLLEMRSVDVPDVGKLGEAFRIELRRAYRSGQASVREEIDRMAAKPELAQAVQEGDFETTRDGIEVESPNEVQVLAEINMTPPGGVRAELKKGLRWHEEGHSGDGLVPATVAWARRLAAGEPISEDKAIKMRAWLARHAEDKKGEGFNPGEDGFPSPGRVAWALWGGDPAVSWSSKLVDQIKKEEMSSGLTGLRYLESLSSNSTLLLAPSKRKVKAKKPDAPGESVADIIDPEEAVENVARTSALAAADRAKTASITAVQSAAIGGVLPAAAVAETVANAVTSLSPGADLVAGQRDTNTIFGLGRMQEARAEGAQEGIRSAMLESATCDVCLSKDGARFAMEDLDEYATPDPDCLGGDQCNCIVIFIPKEE